MRMNTSGEVSLADEVRFAPSPDVIGQDGAILKAEREAGYHPDVDGMQSGASRHLKLPPPSNLRLKVRVHFKLAKKKRYK